MRAAGQASCGVFFHFNCINCLISCTSLWVNEAVLRCLGSWLLSGLYYWIWNSVVLLSLEHHPKPINVRDAFHSNRLWIVLLWRDFTWGLSYFNGYNHTLLDCSQILTSVQVKLWLFSIKLVSSFLFTPLASKYMTVPTLCQACRKNKLPTIWWMLIHSTSAGG